MIASLAKITILEKKQKQKKGKKNPCLNQVGEVVLSSSAIILSYNVSTSISNAHSWGVNSWSIYMRWMNLNGHYSFSNLNREKKFQSKFYFLYKTQVIIYIHKKKA
jgi:hypothetical protein